MKFQVPGAGFQVSGIFPAAGFFVSFSGRAASLAPGEETVILSPAYPEIPPTFWEQYGWWTVAASIVAISVVAVATWFLLRPKPVAIIPIAVQTRQELEALRQQTEDGKILSQISRCLRRYLVIAFSLPAQEMTTAELNRLLSVSQAVGSDLAVSLNHFFLRCDEMKFSPAPAKSPSAAPRALELLELSEQRRAELAAGGAGTPPVIT